MKPGFRTLLVLVVLLLPALFVGLGERPLYKIQEVRIAETAREMLESGDWLIPRYNGELRLQKPPLPYWVTATSYRLVGVSELGVRLGSALAGFLAALLLWNWMRRELGLKIASNTAIVFVTTFLGLRYFRSGEADALLLLFVSCACVLGFGMLHERRDAARRMLFGLVIGLGFLSKGPAAVAIPLVTLWVVAILERRAGRLEPSVRPFLSPAGILLLLVAGFGWYAYIIVQEPEIARIFFARQVDETFISGNHAEPLWWYLAHWFEFFPPWGVLLIPAGLMAYRQSWSSLPPLIRFAWIWLAVVFVILSFTVNKQTQYALLFAPPLAMILGHYLAEAKGRFLLANRIMFWLFCAAVLVGIGFALKSSDHMPSAALWLAIPALPLGVQYLLGATSVSRPVLLVAGLMSMAYLYGEKWSADESHKIDAKWVMQEAAAYSPLYQTTGDGAISFYADRVVPRVDADEIMRLLEMHDQIWVVGEGLPVLPGVQAEAVLTAGDLALYRLQHPPQSY